MSLHRDEADLPLDQLDPFGTRAQPSLRNELLPLLRWLSRLWRRVIESEVPTDDNGMTQPWRFLKEP